MKRLKRMIEWSYNNNDIFYYLSFLSLVFGKTLGLYSGDMEYKIIMIFSMFCLGLKIVFTRYSKKEIIAMGIILAYAVFIYLRTGYITFTITVVTLLGLKGINPKHLLKKVLFIKLICEAVLITASVAGIVDNFVRDQYVDGLTYSYGFQNPNDFMVNIFMTVALIVFLDYDKLNILHFLLSLYAFYVVYRVTNSTTGLLLGVFLVVVFVCLKIFDKLGKIGFNIKKFISMLTIPTSLLCFIATFIVSVYFDVNNKIMFTLDQLVTGRLKIQHQYWLNYGFSVLGKDISRAAARWDGVQINNGFLDSNYWCSFYKYGFVTEMIFIASLIFVSYYHYKKKNYNLVIIINVLCLYGLMEDFLINSIVNPFLIFIGCALFSLSADKKRAQTPTGNNL